MMDLGYAGVQLGTRFIATTECLAHEDYKQAILAAEPKDIVLTERLTGLPCRGDQQRVHPPPGDACRSNRSVHASASQDEVLDADDLPPDVASAAQENQPQRRRGERLLAGGKSVAGIHTIESARDVVKTFAAALEPSIS
jgi:nitronate monooxygenase